MWNIIYEITLKTYLLTIALRLFNRILSQLTGQAGKDLSST